MNNRERFINCILGETIDRAPHYLIFGPWETTMSRWENEGGIRFQNKDDLYEIRESLLNYFNTDVPPKVLCDKYGIHLGPYPLNEKEIIKEDDEYITYINNWGIKIRDFKNKVSMPYFIEFPIKDEIGWKRFKEERLNPDDNNRINGNWHEIGMNWMNNGYAVQIGEYPDVGLFGGLRWLLGDEECLISFYTQPELVHDILDHLASLYLTVFEKIVKKVRIDVVHLWEDMCGRNGPLISPEHWIEFMGPHYKRIKKFMESNNIPIFSVDTDGNPDKIIPPMMKAGVNYIWPMEVTDGCDVNIFRDRYPLLGMMGGIDKKALAKNPDEIKKELERIKPAFKKGRYIPELDHSVPDNVSWKNYLYYTEELKEMIYEGSNG